jgi:hypothetical protein
VARSKTFWEMAMALAAVHDGCKFAGKASFAEYVEAYVPNVQLRTAQHFVEIAKWFAPCSDEVRTWVASLGWAAARRLVKVVDDDTFPFWKEAIRPAKSVNGDPDPAKSVREIADLVKKHAERRSANRGKKPEAIVCTEDEKKLLKLVKKLSRAGLGRAVGKRKWTQSTRDGIPIPSKEPDAR